MRQSKRVFERSIIPLNLLLINTSLSMAQKVVSIRMSINNNTIIGHTERDFIEHAELNKLLESGWKIISTFDAATPSKDGGYACITFVLQKD
jgi:hypothetical protein